MKLLVITQKVDNQDPVLGFFHRWLEELSGYCDRVTIISLQVGRYNLRQNTRVLSLGKETGSSRLRYLCRLARYLWLEHQNYDTVLVHMNQEYILLAGWWWWLGNKRVVMWRNHPTGNWLTDLAAVFCDRIFCTSRYSYTAKYRKTVLMPVGIDTDRFMPTARNRRPRSILFFSRMSPIKRPDFLLVALGQLAERGEEFSADFYGAPPASSGIAYYQSLQRLARAGGLGGRVRFHPPVPNHQAPVIYCQHQIFVNLSPSGMYDKTIFEAAACGVLPLTSNDNLRGEWDERLLFREGDIDDLTRRLVGLLSLPSEISSNLSSAVREYVLTKHSLRQLMTRLTVDLNSLSISRHRQVLKFVLVGSTATLINLASFVLLTSWLGVYYLVSSILAFGLGIAVSFILQKYWTFRDSSCAMIHIQVATFLAVAVFGLGLNAFLVYLLVEYLNLHALLAQLSSVTLIAILNFFVYQKLIFAHRSTQI